MGKFIGYRASHRTKSYTQKFVCSLYIEVRTMSHRDDAAYWHCENCEAVHRLTSRRALVPFKKKCGYQFVKIPKNGDCFFTSICASIGHTVNVSQLRKLVSDKFGEEHLDFYKILATVGGEEYEWAVELEKSGGLKNIPIIKHILTLEGNIVGCDNCIWADSFAIDIIGKALHLNILLIDMSRSKNESPYRFLYKTGETNRYVVLKLQKLHYQPLMYNGKPIYDVLTDLPDSIRTLWEL